jgi:Ca2+-binding EF-hand superfamily protein
MFDVNDTFLLDPDLKMISCRLENGFVKSGLPDFNEDGKVDTSDLALLIAAFGSDFGSERWNSMCDLNNDSQINIIDVAVTARVYGKMSGT